jgi:hypothetical protein
LKKRPGPDKLITTTKWAAREKVLKEQLQSITLEHKNCHKEAKILNNQLCKRDKDLVEISDLPVIAQHKLSEGNSTLMEVIR